MPAADLHIPADVDPSVPLRPAEDDSTLGIAVSPPAADTPAPKHRFVGIGDSLTSGFENGAQTDGQWSFLAIAARALGAGFPTPQFDFPDRHALGGIPLDLERLLRGAQARFGTHIGPLELPFLPVWLQRTVDAHEEFWEDHRAELLTGPGYIPQALAVFGFTLRDAYTRTAADARIALDARPPKDNFIKEFPEGAQDVGTVRILGDTVAPDGSALSQVGGARQLGQDGGIATLVSFIGANDYLGSVADLRVVWSDEDPAHATVKTPTEFIRELHEYIPQLEAVNAQQVVLATIPHVTIAPIAKGFGGKLAPGSRFFRCYGRPWVREEDFDPNRDPHITGEQARAIDAAIDTVNRELVQIVRAHREQGLDWRLLDVSAFFDRLAQRRYLDDPLAAERHGVGTETMPPELAALDPVPTTSFYGADATGRTAGGLVGIDGIHPTRIGHGWLAQKLLHAIGSDATIDFDAVIAADSLITDPPALMNEAFRLVGFVGRVVERAVGVFGRRPVSIHRLERRRGGTNR